MQYIIIDVNLRLKIREIVNKNLTPLSKYDYLNKKHNDFYNGCFTEDHQYIFATISYIKTRISVIYKEILECLGFEKQSTGIEFKCEKRKIAFELKYAPFNKNTGNYIYRKLNKLKFLYPNYQVVYGCLKDQFPKNFKDKNEIWTITGEYLWAFLFKEQGKELIILIEEEIKNKVNEIMKNK